MQNEDYYNAYMREWNKMLKGQSKVTDQERAELHELIEKQNRRWNERRREGQNDVH
jgi:hypothetical protein